MKRLFLIILLFLPITLLAQKFYLRLGANASNIIIKTGGLEPVTQYAIRPNFGFAYEATINKTISFRPELLYSEKGVIIRTSAYKWPQTSFRVGYIETPFFLSFNKKSSKGIRVMFDMGPYIAFGISGSFKTRISKIENDDSSNGKVVFYNEINDDNVSEIDRDAHVLKRTDFGVKAGIGFQFDIVSLNAFYSLGLSNNIPKVTARNFQQNDDKEYNSVLNLSFAFLINEKSLKTD